MSDHTSTKLVNQESILYSNAFLAFMNLPRRKKESNLQKFTFYIDKKEIICSMHTGKVLPHGSYARLLLIWLVTQLKIKKEKTVEVGNSLNEFIKKLNLKSGGKQYKSILEQLDLLSSLAFSFESKEMLKTDFQQTDFNNFFIFKSGRFVENLKNQSIEDTTLEVSSQFFELAQKSFPVSEKDLAQLINFPLAIDLYLWLSPQLFIAKKQNKELTVTWETLNKNFSQYSTENKHSNFNFKKDLKKSLDKIIEINPNLYCNLDTKKGLTILFTSQTFVKQKNKQF